MFHQDGTIPNGGDWIFVFGSNALGIHGAGAALVAYEHFDAEWGCGIGMTGRSFAIPTVLAPGGPRVPIPTIKNCIEILREEIGMLKGLKHFFITRVGCGLAGYQDYEIAPLFAGVAKFNTNASFPATWGSYIR